jgi:hypothetical protein
MTPIRHAYLLTTNVKSDRTIFSANILKRVGFVVNIVQHTPHKNPVISNRMSMKNIYEIIIRNGLSYAYVFEDDIDIHQNITLDELIMYEKISDQFFYLGICENKGRKTVTDTQYSIYGHKVMSISGNVRGLHAIGLSNTGAKNLLAFSSLSGHIYMDMVLDDFSKLHRANIVRYDLTSKIPGHRGLFFQARDKFPTTIGNS